jgi:quercetin dioxygenase-like cupin family protein
MRYWNLRSLNPSTEKETPREPGPDAPRVPSGDRQIPRVLFSSPECRAIVVDLREGEEMGDHQVRERAVVGVVSGRVEIESEGRRIDCDEGTLLTFEPGQPHEVRALAEARLLLLLAPWPAPDHYEESEQGRADRLPPNATAEETPPDATAPAL